MRETGIVTDIRGETAVVKVERLLTTGGGCCGSVTTVESVFLETRNLCQAKIGDHVRVESDYDKVRFRNLAQIGICIAAFIISLGIGDALLPQLGVSTYKGPLSFGLGMVMTIAAFGIIRWSNKKNPANTPIAYELAAI
ncbi:SoxR reducing system RseC family protein [Treponema primitia]|uniref:SoxR reducing system RseC family protein n=1 Tax=Treponema primitia TaxID=88058 RepID=UPI000255502B|nr:SoxR reducing system RseC family protein [Treponema primitia]